MKGYTKLFRSLIYSSVWQEPIEIKVVWITMLAMKDADGKVLCSIPFLAKSAGVSIEQCVMALEKFKSPDLYSSTKTKEGRRIEEVEGGWFVINHFKYMDELSLDDRRAYWALKKREVRARKNALSRKIRKREDETLSRIAEEL